MRIAPIILIAVALTYERWSSGQDLAEVPPGEIAGTVTDEDGKPLENVLVDWGSWYKGNETHSDAAGHFHLKGLGEHNTSDLQISKEGYDPDYVFPQKTGVGDLKFSLNSRTYIEGDVLSPEGKPLPGVQVRAAAGPFRTDGSIITEVVTEATSDLAGHYRIYVRPDKYDIQIRVPGVGAARMPNNMIADGQTPSINIQLEKGIAFKAKFVDSESGEAVPGAKLTDWRHKGIEGSSDENGAITIDGLSPGEFNFAVEKKGYARWWSAEATEPFQRQLTDRSFDDLNFQLQPDMEAVTITLQKAAIIAGHVYDPKGVPIAGATVAPARTGSGNSITGDTRFSVTTGEDGSFTMPLPASGERQYNLVAHDGEYGQTRNWANGVSEPMQLTPGQQMSMDLKLTVGATVKGHAVDATGDPAVDKEVRAISTDGLDNRYYVPSTRTDKDGNYELNFIRPTEQTIQLEPFWLQPGQARGGSSQTMTLEASEVKNGVDLAFQPGAMRR